MRSLFVALVALCILAASVDAFTYRVYRGNTVCSSSGSGNSVRYYFSSIGSCLRTNSTSTNQYEYSKLTKCNSTSGVATADRYGSSTTCSGTPDTVSLNVDTCTTLTTTPTASSYKLSCSAGSVAFSAVVAIIAALALLL